jgi:flagellar motor switch protein FliN/FliY
MATTHSSPALAGEQPRGPQLATGAPTAGEQALVPTLHPPAEGESIPFNGPVARLPVELEVSIPVREFRVRDLLNLGLSQVIQTQWVHDEDMPLGSRDVQLAWSEFEVIDSKLAVRITRLA